MRSGPSSTSARRLSVRFHGHVQGVGFRFTVLELARPLGVTGFIQNLTDGDVMLVAEGPEAAVQKLLEAVRISHVSRRVLREDLSWGPATGEFEAFSIRYA